MTELLLDAQRHAQDLRNTWQARALAETKGKFAAVVLAVLMHNYTAAMQILLRVVFPRAPIGRNGWVEMNPPFYYGTASIAANGMVTCAMFTRENANIKNAHVYDSTDELLKEVRDLGDRLQFTDKERIEMAEACKRWITRDSRIDHMGKKVVA